MNKITICGSICFLKQMQEIKSRLNKLGFVVYIPEISEKADVHAEHMQDSDALQKMKNNLIETHYTKIITGDGILVVNYKKNGIDGYIGGNTLMELGFAFVNKRDIFIINPIPDIQYRAEIEVVQPILIGENLKSILDYYENLPKVYLSSQSALKRDAVSSAFRTIGKKVAVHGFETKSGITEQPMSIDETYNGAVNRMRNLKKEIRNNEYSYLVSIESGLARLHPKHNYFGLTVCIIEHKNGDRKIGITTEIEVPKEMTDLVPNPYADLGVLVQEKYGAKFKDPYIYITHGKTTRLKLLIHSVESTLSQFSFTR